MTCVKRDDKPSCTILCSTFVRDRTVRITLSIVLPVTIINSVLLTVAANFQHVSIRQACDGYNLMLLASLGNN